MTDKLKDKAELAAALANYRGAITRCPPEPTAAPGVSPQEERHNAWRRAGAQRLAGSAKWQRIAQNAKAERTSGARPGREALEAR